MTLTNDQIIARYHDQQRKSKLYWLVYKIEIKLLRAKCHDAGIIVTKHEIENDPEYVAYVKKLRDKK